MPRHTVVVHDRRLEGRSPETASTVVRVSEKTPLSRLVQCLINLSGQHGGEIEVRILCHGYTDGKNGGYGLQLCAEGLTLNTVRQLAPLNGKLSYYMIIFACGTADVAPGKLGGVGDGRLLCSEIARNTGTGLFAADATQIYTSGGYFDAAIDFGAWEGNVLEFNAAGGIERNPRKPRA